MSPLRGGVTLTVARGVWCQVLSLPGRLSQERAASARASRACVMWAWGPGKGPTALLRAVGVVEGCPLGGCLVPL